MVNTKIRLITFIEAKDKETLSVSWVNESCLTIWEPMDCSTPGFPVHHQPLETTQTQLHRVSDAIQPSHPLSSPCPITNNSAQHHVIFQWVSSLHHVATIVEIQLQHQSFQWIFRTDFLEDLTGLNSLQSKGLSRVFSNTTVQKHQFVGSQHSSQSKFHIRTWPLEKP